MNLSIFRRIILTTIFCYSLFITTNLPQITVWIKWHLSFIFQYFIMCNPNLTIRSKACYFAWIITTEGAKQTFLCVALSFTLTSVLLFLIQRWGQPITSRTSGPAAEQHSSFVFWQTDQWGSMAAVLLTSSCPSPNIFITVYYHGAFLRCIF